MEPHLGLNVNEFFLIIFISAFMWEAITRLAIWYFGKFSSTYKKLDRNDQNIFINRFWLLHYISDLVEFCLFYIVASLV